MLEKTRKVLGLIGAALTAGQVIYTIYQLTRNTLQPDYHVYLNAFGRWYMGFQCLVIVILTGAFPPMPKTATSMEVDLARKATKQWLWAWRLLWLSWIFLYATWAYFWPQVQQEDPHIHLLIDTFNVAATCGVILCYIAMSEPTAAQDDDWFPALYAIVTSALVFLGAEAFCTYTWRDSGIETYFDAASGLLAGIGIALFVARLESRLIGTPRIFLVVLYAYAVVQFAYPELGHVKKPGMVEQPPNDAQALVFLVLTTLALVGKLVFFYEMGRLISSRNLTAYMLEYRELEKETKKRREASLARLAPAE